jgi:cell division protein FtsX
MKKVNENQRVILRMRGRGLMKILKRKKRMKFSLMKVIIIALFPFVSLVSLLKRRRMGSDTIFSTPEA